jgi:hypothetical protein
MDNDNDERRHPIWDDEDVEPEPDDWRPADDPPFDPQPEERDDG